jgi:hypothetical protein
MLGRAVGGGDQHRGDLRVCADLVFQHRQVQAVGIEAALDRHLHVGHQRRAIGQFAATLQEHRQGHARRQRRHFARHLFPASSSNPCSAGQAFHVQRFGQVGRGASGRLAHAGAVVAAAHQDERQRRIAFALAHAAQHIQAIDTGQLPVDDHQIVRLRQQLQRLLAVGTHPAVRHSAR